MVGNEGVDAKFTQMFYGLFAVNRVGADEQVESMGCLDDQTAG